MIFHNVDQNSLSWRKLRMGRPTSSCFDRILTAGGKESKQQGSYMHALLAEVVVGHPIIEASFRYMDQGHEREPEAIKAAEFALDIETTPGGFITLDDGAAGCSPDRLIGDDSILEIKCPKESTHVRYMLTKESEGDYLQQLQGQLWISERQSVIICSYHPEIVPVLIKVERDEKYIALLASMVRCFCQQLAHCKEQLVREYGPFPTFEPEQQRHGNVEAIGALGITESEVDELLAAYARGELQSEQIRERFHLPQPKRPTERTAFDIHMEGGA